MNTINKYKIPVQGLPSGDEYFIRVIDIKGPEKGPKCYLGQYAWCRTSR